MVGNRTTQATNQRTEPQQPLNIESLQEPTATQKTEPPGGAEAEPEHDPPAGQRGS